MPGFRLLACMLALTLAAACRSGGEKSRESEKPDHHGKHSRRTAGEKDRPPTGEERARDASDLQNRWGVKTTLPPGADPARGQALGLEELLALPSVPGVTENDPRYQDVRIPASPNPAGLKEGDVVTVSGWLHLVAAPADGDYHLQLTGDPVNGEDCLIVEIPDPAPDFTRSAEMRPIFERARGFVLNQILHGVEPEKRGTLVEPARYVTVTGQLFYDDAHVGEPPRGKRKQLSATLWEIHPVTSIAFATGHRTSDR